MSLLLLLIFSMLGSGTTWLLTLVTRRYALHTNLLDTPNERSSHTVPTPRGGGVGIVLSFLAIILAVGLLGLIEQRLVIATLGAGTMVAVLGFVDDRTGLPARWRFLGHLAAAIWEIGRAHV